MLETFYFVIDNPLINLGDAMVLTGDEDFYGDLFP